MSHDLLMNESWNQTSPFTDIAYVSHDWNMNESCLTQEWVLSYSRMSHVSLMLINESYHTDIKERPKYESKTQKKKPINIERHSTWNFPDLREPHGTQRPLDHMVAAEEDIPSNLDRRTNKQRSKLLCRNHVGGHHCSMVYSGTVNQMSLQDFYAAVM